MQLATTTAEKSDSAPLTAAPFPAVFKLDNILTEPLRAQVYDFLHAGGWRFGWKSSAKSGDQFSFWHRHFAGHRNGRKQAHYDCAEELQKTAPLLFGFWSYLARGPFKGRTLIRCYANAHAYGSDGTIHTDSKRDNSYTAVYYPHADWHPSWGGETVIFNADKTDIIAAVYPKPNRLVVFRGDLPHVARGVSRICPELRITCMFKVGTPDDQG
jgi:SM-20-related protein